MMAGPPLLSLVLAVLSFQTTGELDPTRLVNQLGASSFSERVAAGETLVRLGKRALPALIEGRASRDFEIRVRAEALVTRIEAAAIFGATLVELDLADRSLADAAAAITQTAGMRLRSTDARGVRNGERPWPERRITLRTTEPMPFWKLIDQFCQASGMQCEYPPTPAHSSSSVAAFDLPLIPGRARPPASDTGALRVELLRVSYSRDRNYSDYTNPIGFLNGRPSPRNSTTGAIANQAYVAELLVSAEPRLRIMGIGPVEEVQATDDHGRSLLKEPVAEEDAQRQEILRQNPNMDPRLQPSLRYRSGQGASTRFQTVAVPLTYPDLPTGRIARLRGLLPVMVVTRRPDPLIVPLQDAVGKEFSAGATKIQIHEIKSSPSQDPTVEFTLETAPLGDDGTMIISDSQGVKLAVAPPTDLMAIRLEVLDSQGAKLVWQTTQEPTDQTRGRIGIVIHDRNPQRRSPESFRLRYWETITAATDLPFEFRDVPTP